MQKLIAAISLSTILLFGFYPKENRETKNAAAATCYGYKPCTACR
jgi:hypothetical protein